MTSAPRSRLSNKLGLPLTVVALLATLGTTLFGLSRYGIWDPWELAVADRARKLLEGTLAADQPQTLGLRLVAFGFSSFGPREWAGRLPIALCGLLLLAVTALLVRRFAGTRSAIYATLVLASTPLFVLHSRLMLGATPSFLVSALVLWGAAAAVFPGLSSEHPRAPYAWLGLAALGGLLGAGASGVLLAVLPALGAVAIVSALLGPSPAESPARKHARYLVMAAATVVTLCVVRAVLRREAEYSFWLGGAPNDPSVPTYDKVVEQLFHAFAPWSALLPVALGALLRLDGEELTDRPLRFLCIAWAALAYAAQTLFLSSYGSAAFPAPLALALAVTFWLRDRDEEPRSFWPEVVISMLLLGLVIRDYALYPESPINGLVLGDTKLPATFNPKRMWSLALGGFGAALLVSSMATQAQSELDLKAPYRGILRLFRSSLGHKLWLGLAALLLLGMLVFGILARLPNAVSMTSLARRIGKTAGLVPVLLPLGVAIGQLVFHLCPKLAPLRHGLLLAAALCTAAYTSQGFVPELSGQFSPRKLFDAYNRLARKGEPLVQHQVESGAAHYYAKGEVRDLKSRSELIDYLSTGTERRWAAFPVDQLADIDVAFRRRTKRHLFVPNSENARVTLVASQPIKGESDQNPLARFVRTSVPEVQHPVHANFDDKIELVGYDLELPGKDHLGAGQVFHVTWVWRALQGNLGSYKIFLHLDAPNQRINGDHEPVDGKYPVRLWDEGDVIVDRQEVSVPATSRPGRYVLNVGLFRGEARLKIVEGPQDGTNRLRAGELEVR